MTWRTNKDEALELIVNGKCVAGIWRGAWLDARGARKEGVLAATWHPYTRVGRFENVKAAKAALEKML